MRAAKMLGGSCRTSILGHHWCGKEIVSMHSMVLCPICPWATFQWYTTSRRGLLGSPIRHWLDRITMEQVSFHVCTIFPPFFWFSLEYFYCIGVLRDDQDVWHGGIAIGVEAALPCFLVVAMLRCSSHVIVHVHVASSLCLL
jgi:hypothetical protein